MTNLLIFPIEKFLTRTMFCFAKKGATEAPSSSEKLVLLENGLGEKRVSFLVSTTAANVKEVLYGYDNVNITFCLLGLPV